MCGVLLYVLLFRRAVGRGRQGILDVHDQRRDAFRSDIVRGVAILGVRDWRRGPSGSMPSLDPVRLSANGFPGFAALPTIIFAFGGVELIGSPAANQERSETPTARALVGSFPNHFHLCGSWRYFLMLVLEPVRRPATSLCPCIAHAGLSAAAGTAPPVA